MENLKISEKLFEDVIYFVLGSLDDEVKKRDSSTGCTCARRRRRAVFALCLLRAYVYVCMFECVRAFIHLFWCPCGCTRQGNSAGGKIFKTWKIY